MPTKLNGLHWMAYHMNDSDWQFIRRIRPRSIKIFNDNWRDPFFVERVFAETAPFGTLILFRDHPLSEQHGQVYDNPTGTGQAHARFWQNIVATHLAGIKGFDASRSLFLDANELIPDTTNSIKAITDYNVSYADTLKGSGLRGGLMNLSVGWPTNTGTDTPVNWQPFTPVRDAIKRGNHVMLLHEYFANWQGANFNRGWWIDRLGQCPWDVPIILGEGGVDNYVDWQWAQQVSDQTKRGWSGYWNKEEYITAIGQLDAIYRGDRRVHSVMLFTYDFAHPWHSFDIRPMQMELAAYFDRANAMPDPPALPIPRYPPNVIIEEPDMPDITTPLGDELAKRLQARLGGKFRDKRSTLRRHADWNKGNYYKNVDARPMSWIVLHYSTGQAGPVSTESINNYHIDGKGWPAIGYHFVIDEGYLDYVGDINTQRAHIINANDKGLGICFTGYYETVPLTGIDVAVAQVLVEELDKLFGHKKALKGHKEVVPPGHTACPGKILDVIPSLRVSADPVNYHKAAYFFEKAARELRAEGYGPTHDYFIASDFYAEIKKKRDAA